MSTEPGARSAPGGDTPREGQAERDARRRRREIARQHHPDLGGDPEVFIAAMRALQEPDPAAPTRPGIPVTVRSTSRSRLARTVRRRATRLLRGTRHRIPRSVPGSRRYGRVE
jgi:hypothetical protein